MNTKRLQQSLELMRLKMLRRSIKESFKEKEKINKELADSNRYNNLFDKLVVNRKDWKNDYFG